MKSNVYLLGNWSDSRGSVITVNNTPSFPLFMLSSASAVVVTASENTCIEMFLGPSLNDVRSLGGGGVSKNLTLLNKISKSYTLKV